ncbi:MAG: hemerythrin domain-containing protein [Halioglobus sp.]
MLDHKRAARSVEEAAVFEDEAYSYTRKGPSKKAPEKGDALVGIIDTLYSEHRYILSLLETLELEAEKLKPGKIPDYHLLLDIIDYLTNYPDKYHHPREDLLFAELLEKDKKFQSKLDRLLREHETLHHYNNKLFNELTVIAGGAAVDRPELLGAIGKYITGYKHHIEYESTKIFPLAKGKLSARDLARLSKKTRYLDDPLFGTELQYQYRRLGRSVQSRVGAASEQLIVKEFSAIESAIGKLSGLIDTLEQLREAVGTLGRDSWQEQRETVKAHASFTGEPGLALLPMALLRNHGRHLQQSITQIREILDSDRRPNDA